MLRGPHSKYGGGAGRGQDLNLRSTTTRYKGLLGSSTEPHRLKSYGSVLQISDLEIRVQWS